MTRRNGQAQALVERRATAFHEAGHAVVATVAGGRPVVKVSVRNDGRHLGRVTSRAWTPKETPGVEAEWRNRRHIEPGILSLFAGVLAERRGTGRPHDWTGAQTDIEGAIMVAAYSISGSDRQLELYLAWLSCRTHEILDQWWPAVEAVAEALMRMDELMGIELRDLVRTHAPRPAPEES